MQETASVTIWAPTSTEKRSTSHCEKLSAASNSTLIHRLQLYEVKENHIYPFLFPPREEIKPRIYQNNETQHTRVCACTRLRQNAYED